MNNIMLGFARIFIGMLFLVPALGATRNFSGIKVLYLSIKGIPFPEVFLTLALILLYLGSLSVIIGYRVKIGSLLLMLFLLVVTILYHLDFSNPVRLLDFFKNLAVFGGLILIEIHGPGKYSLDQYLKMRKMHRKK
jgi:putative oxidoreductase